MAELVDLKKLKVAELRKLLQEKGLDTKGNKADLLERLQGANGTTEEDEEDVLAPDEEEEVEEEEEGEEEEEENIEKTEKETTEIPAAETSPKKQTVVKLSGVQPKPITSPVTKESPSLSPTEGLTEAAKIARRAQRFGAPMTADAKKAARAARFGVPEKQDQQAKTTVVKSGSSVTSTKDLDKIKKRAERFGESVSATAVKLEEVERKKRRLERFGGNTTTTTTTKTTTTILPQINPTDAELKKQKRAERFGL